MTIPTISELFTQIKTDLKNRLGIATIFGKVILTAFAAVQAAKLKIFYLSSAFVYRNVFPDQADTQEKGGTLERFGLVKLGRTRNPATAGEYKITVTGTIGSVIAPSTTLKSGINSTNPDKTFIVDDAFTFTATSAVIDIRALDLGATAQLAEGDELEFTAPIAGVDSIATVWSVEVTPVNEEDIEEYRDKVIAAFRDEPQGGARVDYRTWSSGVAGIRQVYPYVKESNVGEISLYVEATAGDSTDGNGTPSAALLDDVKDAIEPEKIPMGVFNIDYLAVIPLPVDIEITGLSDTSFLTSIESAISSFLLNIRPYIDGADAPTETNKDKLYRADIYGIVRDTIGQNATFTSLTMEVDGVDLELKQFNGGNIPYINSVTSA